MIEYNKFQKALKHLELQYVNYRYIDNSLPEITQEAISESVIQRFEICYDCLWKVLKKYLSEELGLPELPNSPKPIFRISAENQVFSSPVEQWIKYANARVAASHDYNGEKAEEALIIIESFISDAISLYQAMSTDTWE